MSDIKAVVLLLYAVAGECSLPLLSFASHKQTINRTINMCVLLKVTHQSHHGTTLTKESLSIFQISSKSPSLGIGRRLASDLETAGEMFTENSIQRSSPSLAVVCRQWVWEASSLAEASLSLVLDMVLFAIMSETSR
jgi:hypothetical protein